MAVLIATPKAADANSYLTVERADQLLRLRLYATAWTNAAATPNAELYQVNNGAGYAIGASTIVVDTGSGTFTAGSKVKFAGHATEYAVSTLLAAPGNLVITPALTAAVVDNEAITRTTPSDRERALIWATSILDGLMSWYGTPTSWDVQSLRWPRASVLNRDEVRYLDQDTIPRDIEDATAELALAVLGRDRVSMPDLLGRGIEEASVGSLSVKVSAEFIEDVIPDYVYALVAHLGEPLPAANTGGTKTLPLERR